MVKSDKEALGFSLRVYKEMREELLNDTKNKNIDLYLGLHSKASVRGFYLDRYNTLWLVGHYERFQEIMERNVQNGQKIYKEQFAESYLQFLKMAEGKIYPDMDFAVELMKGVEGILEQVIDTSLSWDEGYDKLRLIKKKADEKYQKLKKEFEMEEKMAKEELLLGLSKVANAATDLGKAYGNTKIAERMTVLDEQKKQNDFKREGIRFVFGNVSNILDMGVSALADIGVRMAEVKEETVHTEMEIKKAEAEEAAAQKRERFNLEMEKLRKDEYLQRGKDVLESIEKYQIDVADAVKQSINTLACMPVELRQKVEEMLLEETKQYSELQRQLRQDAMDEMVSRGL